MKQLDNWYQANSSYLPAFSIDFEATYAYSQYEALGKRSSLDPDQVYFRNHFLKCFCFRCNMYAHRAIQEKVDECHDPILYICAIRTRNAG